MHHHYAAERVRPEERLAYWSRAVEAVYFPMTPVLSDPGSFRGELKSWEFGGVSLSWLRSDPACYLRERHHIDSHGEQHYLIAISARSRLDYVQDRLALNCAQNQFIIETAHRPYRFSSTEPNEVWALRVPAAMLRPHLRSVDRWCAYSFDAGAGLGGLFYDMVRALPRRIETIDPGSQDGLARPLVEMLALALENDRRVLASATPAVREAHLTRIERHIRRHLADPALSPETIAAACGLSVRYLHELFQPSGVSVSRWIREQRLIACERDLRSQTQYRSIAELAYRWGFGDQAQFSRLFKARFGVTPRDWRAEARAVTLAGGAGPLARGCRPRR